MEAPGDPPSLPFSLPHPQFATAFVAALWRENASWRTPLQRVGSLALEQDSTEAAAHVEGHQTTTDVAAEHGYRTDADGTSDDCDYYQSAGSSGEHYDEWEGGGGRLY